MFSDPKSGLLSISESCVRDRGPSQGVLRNAKKRSVTDPSIYVRRGRQGAAPMQRSHTCSYMLVHSSASYFPNRLELVETGSALDREWPLATKTGRSVHPSILGQFTQCAIHTLCRNSPIHTLYRNSPRPRIRPLIVFTHHRPRPSCICHRGRSWPRHPTHSKS